MVSVQTRFTNLKIQILRETTILYSYVKNEVMSSVLENSKIISDRCWFSQYIHLMCRFFCSHFRTAYNTVTTRCEEITTFPRRVISLSAAGGGEFYPYNTGYCEIKAVAFHSNTAPSEIGSPL